MNLSKAMLQYTIILKRFFFIIFNPVIASNLTYNMFSNSLSYLTVKSEYPLDFLEMIKMEKPYGWGQFSYLIIQLFCHKYLYNELSGFMDQYF